MLIHSLLWHGFKMSGFFSVFVFIAPFRHTSIFPTVCRTCRIATSSSPFLTIPEYMNMQIFLTSKLLVMPLIFSEHFQQLMWKQPSSVKLCTCVIRHSDAPIFNCRNEKKNTFLTRRGRLFFFLPYSAGDWIPWFWLHPLVIFFLFFWGGGGMQFIFHQLPSCLPPFSNSQLYSWCKNSFSFK